VGPSARPSVLRYDTTARRYDVVTSRGSSPEWLEDGRIVYVLGKTIQVLDPGTRQSTELLTVGDDESLVHLRVTSDNRFLYFLVGTAESDIWMATFDGR
jgi:hypothetical protein